jgi:hypothetical protein
MRATPVAMSRALSRVLSRVLSSSLLAALLTLCSQLAIAQTTVQQGMRVNADAALRIWIPAGELQVTAWDLDSISVEAVLPPDVRLIGGGAREAAKYAVQFADAARSGLPDGKLVVRVPRRATLWIKATTAEVSVRGAAAELDVLSVTGRVFVRDVDGSTTVEAINAPVAIDGTRGTVRVRGGSGPVRLSGVAGRIDVTMVSGSVTVAPDPKTGHMPGGRIETVGGTVTLSGALAPRAALAVDTHDGAIELRLPTDRPPLVRASGVGLTLPSTLRGRPTVGTLDVRTFSGTLNVRTLGGT